jgi:hypothetical protein
MIHILINGKELVLRKNTTVSIELNNALMSEEEIDGDITYSFTLPSQGNEEVLGFPNLDMSDYSAEFDCLFSIDGASSIAGRLLVQKASYNELTAAIIITPYPKGFADRNLRHNDTSIIDIFDYGWLIAGITPATHALVLTQSFVVHNSLYKAFLEKTTEENSDIKFAPFFNDTGYGDANKNFGFWNGSSHAKIVNRLFFNNNGKVVMECDNPYFTRLFSKIFHLSDSNDSNYVEMNQVCLCPQIRLGRVLEEWCSNAGYQFINHLGDDLKNIFIQSTKAIDGTAAQYQDGMYNKTLSLTRWTQFVLPEAGWYKFDFGNTLDSIIGFTSNLKFIAIESSNAGSGNDNAFDVSNDNGTDIVCLVQPAVASNGHLIKNVYISKDYTGIGLRMMVGVYIHQTGHWTYYNSGTTYLPVSIRQLSRSDEQGGLNIYRRSFSLAELMPDVTNAEFLKTCMETLGLCYFVSRTKRVIEIVPFSLIKDCNTIDLTDYVLVRETETSNPEDKNIVFRLPPLKDDSFDASKRLPDGENYQPDPYEYPEKCVLVERTNTIYVSETVEEENAIGGWIQKWNECCGNPDRLESGKGAEENHEPTVKIPHQRYVSEITEAEFPHIQQQLPVASFTISSDLYNKNENSSDIILMQYRGLKKWGKAVHPSGYNYFWQECMLPVYKDEFALRAQKGRWVARNKTLGEDYAMPALELSGHKTLTYKLRLPKSKIQEVENLLRPSDLPPAMQTRFIIINNVKTVPKRIVMQIENDNCPDVLCEIEAVRLY